MNMHKNKPKYFNISQLEKKSLIYKSPTITTPFGEKVITYADFIGSGQPCPLVENYILKHIYPFYANTHSNAYNGILMKNKIEHARKYVKKVCNVDDNYKLLFCGNGTTGCFNHLVSIIDYHIYDKIIIFVSTFEHYSNYLPWLELMNASNNIILKVIPIDQSNNLPNISFLKTEINNFLLSIDKNKLNLVICSITACSNVTGSIMPLEDIAHILNEFNETHYFKKLFFADFACSAPYVKINGSMFDGFAFSGHKFSGGVGTPGVLIAKEHLFNKSIPHDTGGGCVCKCTSKEVVYEKDIEKRESAGTQNIIGILKLEKAISLKMKLFEVIESNENLICNLLRSKINEFTKKYDSFVPILSNHNIETIKHIPIFTFGLKNVHYNFIVVLLNDLFGIQTRGGISCCGLLGEHVEKNFGINGWCRISFHWTMNYDKINEIFDNVDYIINNNKKYEHLYTYNSQENLFYHK